MILAMASQVLAPPSRKLLRLSGLRRKLGDISIPTVYRWMQEIGLPRPIKLTRNVGMWDEAEVDAWIESRASERSNKS
jgi:predicted DNA-binding transcriptional regulator AlpA